MSDAKNKVDWCLKKAERELKKSGKHRGLVKTKPNIEKAREYIKKAEHYLRATNYLKKGDFSDISASTVFYSMYHCLLAIAAKFGYESRNQECTITAIEHFIQGKKLDIDQSYIDMIRKEMEGQKKMGAKSTREEMQYGAKTKLEETRCKILMDNAKRFVEKMRAVLKTI